MFPRCKIAGCPFTATHAPTVVAHLCDGRTFEIVIDILLCHDHARACETDTVLTERARSDIHFALAAQVGGPFEVHGLSVCVERRPETPNDMLVRRAYLNWSSPVGGSA